MSKSIAIEVAVDNVLNFWADVLALKYAQDLYGVDALVSEKLQSAGRHVDFPPPWGFRLEQGVDAIAADRLLIVGVPPLSEFGYREIRAFGRKVLTSLAGKAPETRSIALTLHGAGYGLDEVEAFEAEVAGLLDAISSDEVPEALTHITFVERNRGRAKRMGELLAQLVPGGLVGIGGKDRAEADEERLRAAGYASDSKAHVFVAMPFKDEMDDVYHYGIQSAIRAAGFLCERADLSAFTGDVLEWVRNRIRTASFVVADLTEANPNVYLEVGYAWGCGVPTVLLTKSVSDLKFDVRTQRCLTYTKIKELEEALTKELAILKVDK